MNVSPSVHAERLELVASTPAVARAAHEDRVALGELLNCAVSNRWPPELVGEALEPIADEVSDAPERGPWTLWYAVDRSSHLLVGNVRFHGPPTGGAVEIRYAMADDERGKGYATEAVREISAWALAQPTVTRILARVEPENVGAIRVLEKAGFERCDEGDADAVVYERVG